MTKKFAFAIIITIICCISTFISLFVLSTLFIAPWVEVLIYLCILAMSIICMVARVKHKTVLYRSLFVINILLSSFILIYSVLFHFGILNIFSSVMRFRDFILSTGQIGVLIYILIQFAQVVFLPIPAAIIALAGSLIYGPLLGSIYCSVGILGGSYFSFFLGKTCGFRLVSWITGKETAVKYANILSKRGGMFLALAFLLPLFPDDILCLISGLTAMKFSTFAIIATIFRPIGVFCMCYFGGGHVIPFHGWGLYVWGVILVVFVVIFILMFKYQQALEDFIVNKITKKKKNN